MKDATDTVINKFTLLKSLSFIIIYQAQRALFCKLSQHERDRKVEELMKKMR